MYNVHFYRNKDGNEQITEYLNKLKSKSDKKSRIKLKIICDYINVISEYGIHIGENFGQSVESDIWKLKPVKNKVILAIWIDGCFVMLRQFTEKNSKNYEKEMILAKEEAAELSERVKIMSSGGIGSSWKDICNEFFTPFEIAESNFRVSVINEIVKAKQKKGIDTNHLEILSDIAYKKIKKMKTNGSIAKLNKIIKILIALDKTLKAESI
ncbi:MAG: hypothetical protein LBM93_01705 [Oscillospiraceae bacterium]|nr:hypothetical protein [Oscillospiraceae bacterium]